MVKTMGRKNKAVNSSVLAQMKNMDADGNGEHANPSRCNTRKLMHTSSHCNP